MTEIERRRRVMIGGTALIPVSAWQTITLAGSNGNSISFPISADTTKSWVAYVTSDAEGNHDPACMKVYSGVMFVVNGSALQGNPVKIGYDTANFSRNSATTVTATSFTISAAANMQFSSDVSYTLHYAEFDAV